jgi:hypothetical protein
MYVDKTNYEDIVKYYKKTYVKLRECGEVIYLITEVYKDKIILQDIQGEEVAICLEQGYNLDYVIPKKTVYQHGENALFLSRIPARMWQKGMSNKNTMFQLLSAAGSWHPHPFDIKVIDGFVNKPSYFSLDDAVTNFTKGDHLQSAALTPRISMSRKGAVFIDTVMVGRFAATSRTVTFKKIFRDEIVQAFPGCKYKEL